MHLRAERRWYIHIIILYSEPLACYHWTRRTSTIYPPFRLFSLAGSQCSVHALQPRQVAIIMELILNGNSTYSAHALKKKKVFAEESFQIVTDLDLIKCLKRKKSPLRAHIFLRYHLIQEPWSRQVAIIGIQCFRGHILILIIAKD